MKKKLFIITILSCIVLLTSCKNNKKEVITEPPQVSYDETVSNYAENEGYDSYNVEEIDNLKNLLNDEFNMATDLQNNIIEHNIAKSNTGYYSWGVLYNASLGKMMSYYDLASGKYIPLCNRPDCKHDDENCNAALGGLELNVDYFDFLFFYEDNLYVTGINGEGYVSVYRVLPDGSNVEEYMKLFKYDSSEAGSTRYYPEIIIHRGYVYYIDNNESIKSIKRKKLGDDEEELIYKENKERFSVYRIRAYGDYIFFQAGTFSEDMMNMNVGLYCYNAVSRKVSLVKSKIIAYYVPCSSGIVYKQDKGIYFYSYMDAAITHIMDVDKIYELYADDKYIYIDDFDTILIYDYEGKEVHRIRSKDEAYILSAVIGMDDEFIFGVNEGCGFPIVDKSGIENKKTEWNVIRVENLEDGE